MATTNSASAARHLPYLEKGALILSFFPTIVGLRILIEPQFALRVLQFPTPSSAADRNLVYGLVRLFGARDLAIGVTAMALWYYGHRKSLGAAILSGAILTVTDGIVSGQVIGKGQWIHWGFVPLNLGLGLGLLEWI